MDTDKFEGIIFTILFAVKHEKPELMEIGLDTLFALNSLAASNPQISTIFFKNFYLLIIRDIFTVMTDYRHMSGFKTQGYIVLQLIQIIENGNVLFDKINVDG
jgi:exportin-1